MAELTKCRCSEIILGEASTCYGKVLTRLTHPVKTPKNAHNTGFLRLARPGSAGRGVHLGAKTWERPGPSLRFVSSGQALWLTAWPVRWLPPVVAYVQRTKTVNGEAI
jgi:hypothetical protein